MDSPHLRGLVFIQNGLRIIAVFLIFISPGIFWGVGVGEVSQLDGTIWFTSLCASGIFFWYLAQQLRQFKKWAYYAIQAVAVIPTAWFIYQGIGAFLPKTTIIRGSLA